MTLHLPGSLITSDDKHLYQTLQKIAGMVTTLVLAAFLLHVTGCGSEISEPPPIEQDGGLESLFFMDLVPATGLGLYTTIAKTHEDMAGGIFRLDGDRVEVVTRDLVFSHNIEPFNGGYILTDTDQDFILVVTDSGETVQTLDQMVWLEGQRDSLRDTNWVLPLQPVEVKRFLGKPPPDLPVVLICRARTIGGEEWMWWAICAIEDSTLRSLWEMESSGRKSHAGLLHDGIFYGAASGSHTLIVQGADLQLELAVGNIRYMEVAGGKLWMAGDDFVGVFDNLPPARDEKPRVFSQGIGRVQAVHEFEDQVFVTANGRLLVYDLEGRLKRSIGQSPPRSGESWIHDRLRALGYLE